MVEIKSEIEILDELENLPVITLGEEQIIDNLKLGTWDEEKINPIKKINRPFSYEELKNFTNSDNPQFYIGTGAKFDGMVSYFTEEYKSKIVLVRIVRLINRETDEEGYKFYFLTDPIPERERGKVHKTIEAEFYLYRFTSGDKRFILFSEEKLELEDYHIRGTIVEASDYTDLSKNLRIGIRHPLLFVNKAIKREVKFQSHKQFFDCFKPYNLTRKKLIDWLFTSPQGYVYEFPESFIDVLISNLLATPDEFNSFHLPALIISETGTGKTTAIQLIFNKMAENFKYVKMTGSTLKGLVPSFKNPTDLKQGLFLEAKRYCPIDELFAGFINIDPDQKQVILERLKDILDYEEAEYRSGQGIMRGRMRAEHIALTNPKSYGNNILQLSKHFFPEILARYLIWYVPKEQAKFIDERKRNLKKADTLGMTREEFLAGLDYLKTFNCEYDLDKVKEIYKIGENFLESRGEFTDVKSFYRSRYLVHACRMLDSLIKFRVWTEGGEFKAIEQDYSRLKGIWLEMLSNWGCGFQIVETQKVQF